MAMRLALRSLLRAPGYALAVVLTLTLGLAAVGSMFAIVYGVLLAPLPYAQPEQLVSVGLETPEQSWVNQPLGIQTVYERHARSLQAVALYRSGSSNVRLPDGADADSVAATWVTASMLPLLRVTPLLGRGFNADEELRGGPNAVILSEAEWRTRFGASEDVIGRTLIVNDAPRTVVGVMPAAFAFPTAATRVWLPVKHSDSGLLEDFSYAGVARLAPGIGVQQAQGELEGVLPRIAELYPRLATGGSTADWLSTLRARPQLVPLRESMTGDVARTLWMLAAAAGLVLLVAWANVANLAWVRVDAGQADIAVRTALGAGRWRAAAGFLAEAALLGFAAGLWALLAAHAAVRAVVAFGPEGFPRLAELGVGWETVAFMALLSVAGVVLCAALPVLRTQRGSLGPALHDGGRGQTSGKPRQRMRAAIATLQIALALVVLIGSALLLRSAQRLQAVDPGFDAREVSTLRILLPYARYGDAARLAFQAELVERVRQLPSVQAAGMALQLPLAWKQAPEQRFRLPGEAQPRALPVNVIGDGYFGTLRIPLLAGRDFRTLGAVQAGDIILSRRAAVELFGDSNVAAAVGRSLTLADADGPTYTVVGVAGDVRQADLASAPPPLVYLPQALPGPRPGMALVVRSTSDALPAIRQQLRELDPTVPLYQVQSMDDVLRASTARLRLTAAVMSAAAAVALLLGMIGLYGVMAYLVALRTREFGVRLALGADPRRIARAVLGGGLALAAGGIAAGLVLHALAAPLLRTFLFGVTAHDPPTLAGAALLLAATAALASWLPARRAARVDPALALRAG